MSSHGANGGEGGHLAEMGPLDEVVNRVVAELQTLRTRVKSAEERATQSDELLRQFVGGQQDPGALSRRVEELEAENESLRARIAEGRAGVDRALAKVRFLEDRR